MKRDNSLFWGVGIVGVMLVGWYVWPQNQDQNIPFAQRVSPAFITKVKNISALLGIPPAWLMAIMHFETAGTFSPSIQNGAGSSGVGLLQFLEATAHELGTTTTALKDMSAEQQLDYVFKYLWRYRRSLVSLAETYTAVIRPAALGLPMETRIFLDKTLAYRLNRSLDSNRDGVITKQELVQKVLNLLHY